MDNLVLSNLLFRKTRTLASVGGIALGVVLVVLTVGMSHGFLNEQGRRNSAVSAEIWLRPPGGFRLSLSSTLSIPVGLADQIRSIEGVTAAVPVGNYIRGTKGLVNGIDYASFTRVSEIEVIDGRPLNTGDEAIVDRILERNRKLKVGDQIQVFERPFRVVGIYEPESLGRIKVPLATMQQATNTPGLCSMILIKLDNPSKLEAVADILKTRFPDYTLDFTRDLPVLYAQGTPALRSFLNVVVILAVVISTLIILLAMYTTVTERTRQIGILKSLGASRGWIAFEIEKEALLISGIGVLAGFAMALGGKLLIERLVSLNVDLEVSWVLYAVVIGILSGALGALYPALRAAAQDPVRALSYE